MAKGLGRALQTVLDREGPGPDLEVEGPSLANARRRAVFRYLCARPCARVGPVGRELGMSQATVRWHEADLTSKGYLEVEGPSVFPRGLIDPEDVVLFSVLAAPGRSAVLSAAFSDPGVSLLELASRVGVTRQSASKLASELSDLGLLTLVEDGRFRRHYATDLLARKREANLPRARAFAESLVRRLGDEGLSPETLRDAGGSLVVRFGVGATRVVLDVPLDPYATAWRPAV